MEDAKLVCGVESVGNLNAGGEHELQAGGSFPDHLVEALAGNVLHDDVGLVLATVCRGFANVVDGADVRVIDSGGEPGFSELGGAHLLKRLGAALEELEHDRPLQQRVGCEVHNARAARSDLAQELIVPDCAALHDFIIASSGCDRSARKRVIINDSQFARRYWRVLAGVHLTIR